MFLEFLQDIKSYIKYKKNEKKYKLIFFVEGEYLKPYINYLLQKKKNYAIITFEENSYMNYKERYYFHSNLVKSIFFNLLNVKKVYTSTPALNSTVFRRSVNKRVKYIYIQHSPVSLSMAYEFNAFNYFDAVQVINKFQYADLLEINELYSKKIKPIKSKYYFLKNFSNLNNNINKLLIAPTWNTNFYKKKIHLKLKEILDHAKIDYEIRPHKMSILKNEVNLNELKNIGFKLNTETLCNLNNYNNLITDWSGIYIEFAMLKKIKPICINSDKKIRNNNPKKMKSKPAEIFLRDKLANVVEINDLKNIVSLISKNNNDSEKKEITKTINQYFY